LKYLRTVHGVALRVLQIKLVFSAALQYIFQSW
jgi:hypothetical protein